MINSEESKEECPLCQEYLKKNLDGKMTFNNLSADVYFCEECNQSFALDVGQIKLIPYDSDMKKIENECKVCKKVENFNQKGLFMLNVDTAYYEFHCFDCAKPILQEWANSNCKEGTKVDDTNIQEIYTVYDFNKNNEMLKELRENPDKYKETMDKVKQSLRIDDAVERIDNDN